MAGGELGHGQKLLAGHHGAGGVAGVGDHQHAGAVGNGRLQIRTFPQSIEDLSFNLHLKGREATLLESDPLRGRIAQGALKAWGQATWEFGGISSYDFHSQVDDFQLRDVPEGFELYGSLDAELKGTKDRGGLLSGTLRARRMAYQAEINLRDRDIANMGFAEAVDCPVVLVADIDRGGVFAHLVGTLALLSESEQQRTVGFLINRFRGDIGLLQAGLDWLEQKTGKPVLGAPGCARSPRLNGFDWVLDRIFSDIPVTKEDIAGMGVGGLLMEIPTRPQPREPAPSKTAPSVHAVLLAAGRSSRMGGPNKLMALFDGKPLVRRTVERALASKARIVIVVTGHQEERVKAALDGLPVTFADNPAFAEGLSTSLKAGIGAFPASAAGALVVLGDMPGVSAADLDRLIEVFHKSGDRAVVRATHEGKRGNPVLLPRSLFEAIAHLEGDTGARHLVENGGVEVVDVEIGAGEVTLVGAFKSDLGQAVLCDLNGGAIRLHLATKLLELGHGQARIVGHDDDRRVRKHIVQRRDGIFLCRFIHWALSGRRQALGARRRLQMPLPETPVDTGVRQSDAWCPVPAPEPRTNEAATGRDGSNRLIRTSRSGTKLLHRLCRPLGEIMLPDEPGRHLQSQTGLGDS